MYKNIKSFVFSEYIKSKYFGSNADIRQGGDLSPLLFVSMRNNYIDFKDDVANNSIKLFILLCADDTIILSNSTPEIVQ